MIGDQSRAGMGRNEMSDAQDLESKLIYDWNTVNGGWELGREIHFDDETLRHLEWYRPRLGLIRPGRRAGTGQDEPDHHNQEPVKIRLECPTNGQQRPVTNVTQKRCND